MNFPTTWNNNTEHSKQFPRYTFIGLLLQKLWSTLLIQCRLFAIKISYLLSSKFHEGRPYYSQWKRSLIIFATNSNLVEISNVCQNRQSHTYRALHVRIPWRIGQHTSTPFARGSTSRDFISISVFAWLICKPARGPDFQEFIWNWISNVAHRARFASPSKTRLSIRERGVRPFKRRVARFTVTKGVTRTIPWIFHTYLAVYREHRRMLFSLFP